MSSANRLPKDAPSLMALAQLVTLSLYSQVKKEGCIVPWDVVKKGLGQSIFFAWPRAQVKGVSEVGSKLIDRLFAQKHPIIDEVSKCVTLYIEQQGIEESKLKNTDFIYLLSRTFERISGRDPGEFRADQAVLNR